MYEKDVNPLINGIVGRIDNNFDSEET